MHIRATSHTSQEPWPWHCESPKQASQGRPNIMYCGHRPSSLVWSHRWPGRQPNATSLNFYSNGSSCMIKHNKATVVSIRGAMVSRFYVRPTSKEVVFGNSPSDHETWFVCCHVRVHVDFTSILDSHTPLVPQALCEANLDWLRLFHQWECWKCHGQGLSVSCVKCP